MDTIDFDLICHKIVKSDKGEYSICTLQSNYTRQNCLFIKYVNINYRLIHGHFHIGLVIIPRPQYGSRDDNQANMEMSMYDI